MNDLRELAPGDIFVGAHNRKYIVLENNRVAIFNTAVLIKKTCIDDATVPYDRPCRKYKDSNVRNYLERYLATAQEDVSQFGEIIEANVNTMCMNGQYTEGVKDKIRLMSLSEYQRYRQYLNGHDPRLNYWLATENRADGILACHVRYNGGRDEIVGANKNNSRGVRPIFTVRFKD